MSRCVRPRCARSRCTRHMLILLWMLLLQASRDWRRSRRQIWRRVVQNLGSIEPERKVREENASKHSQKTE